ncbi:MAG: mandelate racemase/muconate lactonizing enzyme family protein [Hyphomicrobiales bacterium]
MARQKPEIGGFDSGLLDVEITGVEAIPLRIPLNNPTKLSHGAARDEIDIVVVRLHTSAGVSGVGETQAWRRQGNAETLPGLLAIIREHFTPLLIGRSPFALPSLMQSLDSTMYHTLYAQAPIGDALYDLQGKLLGVPLYMLLGGKCRDKVSVGCVVYIKPTLEETLALAQDFYDQGIRSFSVKIGNDFEADLRNVRAVRERFGDEIVLRVDANAAMEFNDSLRFLRKIEPLNIAAAEQMVPMWDVDGMAELARRVDIPLMTDECVATDRDLINVIRKRAASVTQTKIGKNGGVWRCHRLWQIADAAGMQIYPGNHPATSIAILAKAHLAAAWPGSLLDGVFACGIGVLSEDVVTEPVCMDGRYVPVPDAPGLGVTLDEDRIGRFRVDL